MFFIRSESEELYNVHSKRRAHVIIMNIFDKIIFEYFEKFKNLKNVNKVYKLSKHDFINHIIELKKDKSLFSSSHYFLLRSELKVCKKYLNKYLKNDFIQIFQSLAETFILFVKKKNNRFQLCVNYTTFNNLIINHRYSLSLIDKSLNRLNKIKIFIDLNLIATYYRMRIKKSNE